MARRYARDNKGRFASAGTGATARGGRLRTAAGNKRATVKANPGVSSGRISSVPKGAVGKTGSARSANQISRGTSSEQRTAYKKQRTEAKARKSAPKETSLEEFARKTGGATRADTMSLQIEVSRQPRGRTKAGDRRNEAKYKELDAKVKQTEAAYNKAIQSGQIKAPVDSLARKAQGEPSNPAVQAAKRLQEKTAKLRAKNEAQKAAASTPRSNAASLSPRTRRIRAEKSKYTAYAAKQFRADKTGIGELTVAQVSSKNWKLPRSMRKK